MEFIRLVSKMSEDTFAELVGAAPRKTREQLFQSLGIKAKKTIGLKLHAKTEERTKKLHEKLKVADSDRENRLCEELVRTWLYTKRPLLKATLDHLGVKNDNGLVEEEPTFFQELSKEKVQELFKHLQGQGFPAEHIALYLHFVKTPHVDDVLGGAAAA